MIEYAGPIFIHALVPLLRPLLYRNATFNTLNTPFSTLQQLSMGMIIAHFIKRELETLFIHKFSSNTMPLFNLFKNSAHYWVLSGFNLAYWIYSPTSPTAAPSNPLITAVGLALFLFGELANLSTHLTLSNLRTRGGTERGIPRGFGFGFVTCPNYFFEIVAWIGVCLVSWSWSAVLFTVVAWWQMQQWATDKERAYRKEFGAAYRPKQWVLTPGIPAPKVRAAAKAI